MIGRTLDQLCNVLKVLLAVLIAALAVPVAMQILGRDIGIIPSYLWTEELATFIFVWIVMIGAMVAVWEGTHFDVRVIPDAKRPLLILLQDGFVLVVIFTFGVMFAWYGIEFAKIGYIQNSVMMRANLLFVHVTVPIAGVIWTLFSGYRLHETIMVYKNSVVEQA